MIPTQKQLRDMSEREFETLLHIVRNEVEYRRNTCSTFLESIAEQKKEYHLMIGQTECVKITTELFQEISDHYSVSGAAISPFIVTRNNSECCAFVLVTGTKEQVDEMLARKPPVSVKDRDYYKWSKLRYMDTPIPDDLLSAMKKGYYRVPRLRALLEREI